MILEDDPQRMVGFDKVYPDAFHSVTSRGFIRELEKRTEKIDLMFLDHDLGNEVFVNSSREDCGMEVVRWLEENEKDIDLIVVHSYNGPAAEVMEQRLLRAGYRVRRIPFMLLNLK